MVCIILTVRQTAIGKLLGDSGINQGDIAAVLGMEASAISHKLAGRRPWRQSEMLAVREYLCDRLGQDFSLDDLFSELPALAKVSHAS